jgi:Sulfate permease family
MVGEDRPPGRRQDLGMAGDGDPARDSYGKGVSPFRPAARKPVLHRVVPVSEQLPGYRAGVLRRDLLAGVTVAALALPAAMAYAELAGLSPVAGLYALLLPTVAYALLGSSRQIIVGPEGSIAALTATALVPIAADDPERYASLAAANLAAGITQASPSAPAAPAPPSTTRWAAAPSSPGCWAPPPSPWCRYS